MSFELSDLPKREFNKIIRLLEPEGFWKRATKLGGGEPVLGATATARERRAEIRKIISKYRKKHGRGFDLELALLMRTLGWPLIGQYRAPTLYEGSSFRRLACAFWPQGAAIPGKVVVETDDADQYLVYRSTCRAVSQYLKETPMRNLAVLNGRVWRRHDSQIMTHVETRTDLWSFCFSAADRTDDWVQKRMRKGLFSAVKFSKKALSKVAVDLLIKWADYGFLASPAGAMISMCGQSDDGWGALVPANGIPLVICVNRVTDGKCSIGVTPDHRAFDGKGDMEAIYAYLRKEIPAYIRRAYEEDFTDWWTHRFRSGDST